MGWASSAAACLAQLHHCQQRRTNSFGAGPSPAVHTPSAGDGTEMHHPKASLSAVLSLLQVNHKLFDRSLKILVLLTAVWWAENENVRKPIQGYPHNQLPGVLCRTTAHGSTLPNLSYFQICLLKAHAVGSTHTQSSLKYWSGHCQPNPLSPRSPCRLSFLP